MDSDNVTEDLDYLQLIKLRTRLVSYYSKILTNNHGSMSLPPERIPSVCSKIYEQTTFLVDLTQKLAKDKQLGKEISEYRTHARSIKKYVKNLIYHTQNPDSILSAQADILMNISIKISFHFTFILSSCIKKEMYLKGESHKNQPIPFIFVPNEPKTYEEMLSFFLTKTGSFMKLLQTVSQEAKQFMNTYSVSNESSICLLSGSLQYQEEKELMIKRCDILKKSSNDVFTSARNYIISLSNPRIELDLLSLITSFRSNTSNIICIINSILQNDDNLNIPIVNYHIDSIPTDNMPYILKRKTLFRLGSMESKERVLNLRTEEISTNCNWLKYQLNLVESTINVHQKRLQQLKDKEILLNEFEESRKKREIEWKSEEFSSLDTLEKQLISFNQFIEEKKQEFKIHNIEDNTKVVRCDSLESDNISAQRNRSFKKRITRSKVSRSLRRKESKSEITIPKPSRNSAELTNSQPERYRHDSSPTIVVRKYSSYSPDIPIRKELSVEETCSNIIKLNKLTKCEDKITKLQEQLKKRSDCATNFSKKTSESAIKQLSIEISSIKSQKIEILKKIRELLQRKNNLLSQIKDINYIEEHKNFLNIFEEKKKEEEEEYNDKLIDDNNNHLDLFSILENAVSSFQFQLNIILERFSDEFPKENQNPIILTNIWDESLISNGSNKTVIYSTTGCGLRAGTLNQLVMKLTDEKKSDPEFLRSFIYTFQSFTTPDILLQKLIERYTVPRDSQSEISDEQWKQTVVLPIQYRVCNVIRTWLQTRFQDFDYKLMKKLNNFIDTRLRKDGHSKQADTLYSYIKREIAKQHTKILITPIDDVIIPEYKDIDLFTPTPAIKIAEHITAIDEKLYCSITSIELSEHLSSKNRCPNVIRMIDRFNTVSSWVAYLIVSSEQLNDRIATYIKLVEIAGYLRELNNFNGLLAVIGGLNNSAVYRLKHTHDGVPQQIKDKLKILKDVMSSAQSYKAYRNALHNAQQPLIPYMGVYLTDLTFINDGNPNRIDGLINFRKRELVYRVIDEFRQYQSSYAFDIDEDLFNYLVHTKKYDEKELFDLSYLREERQS